MKLQSNVNKLQPNTVEYIYLLNETDHQWDFAGRREENSELWENAAELLSKEEILSWFTDRKNKASHGCEYF